MLRGWVPIFAMSLATLACDSSDPASNPQKTGGGTATKTGGTSSAGGSMSTGGSANTGGSTSTGGTTGNGGTTSNGGGPGTGGTASNGGTTATGGKANMDGSVGGGGSSGILDGSVDSAGAGSKGGSGGNVGGGAGAMGGAAGGPGGTSGGPLPLIKISENNRFLQTADGQPFFWLGDTSWLLFVQLKREEVETYLENRRQRGFNVIQIMVLDNIGTKNKYGDTPFSSMASPTTTPGSDPANAAEYDWWDHADFVIDLAAKKGIYAALVPMWGNPWVSGNSVANLKAFTAFLASRYKDRTNIIYMNGGDRPADSEYTFEKWTAIGETLRQNDPNHIITYHPRGQQHSSTWFHKSAWLDFNMVQTGHTDQNNWAFISKDYALTPPKPTLDGEPAYEEMPVGLKGNVYWTDLDNRRNAWWSVLAGAAGHTYGHNAIWQFNYPGYAAKFGCKSTWMEGITFPGAAQMQHVKNLMLARPYFERVPDQSLVAKQGTGHGYLVASRGEKYAFIYSALGASMEIAMGKIAGAQVKASWYDPKTGKFEEIGPKDNAAGTTQVFDPPGEPKEGNDWVLVLDSM